MCQQDWRIKMLDSKVYQIEINSEQPEWRVIQSLVRLGFQKAMWQGEINTNFIEVYISLKAFTNYSNNVSKDNVVTLLEFTNLVYEEK